MLTLLTPHGPRPVEAMLFDMDGTMAHSRPFHLQSWEKLAGRLHPEVDWRAVLRTHFGLSNRQIIPRLAPRAMSLEEIDALSDEKEALYRELARGRVQPVGGLCDLVKRAHQAGVRLAVASSALEANVRFILREFGLEPYFAATVHCGRVRRGKPDPETFLLAARDVGAWPSRCVVFEDAPAGLEGARQAGMTAIGIESAPGLSLRPWADMTSPDFCSILRRLTG